MTFTENLLVFFIPKEKEDNKCGCYCEKVYAIEEKYLELKKDYIDFINKIYTITKILGLKYNYNKLDEDSINLYKESMNNSEVDLMRMRGRRDSELCNYAYTENKKLSGIIRKRKT